VPSRDRCHDTKKQDSMRVDKLRTIVLMEADFNYLNKIVGRRILKNAEETKYIAQEQFGSRKKKVLLVMP
jgi:hypothetical protein